jgi:hypothetical protein
MISSYLLLFFTCLVLLSVALRFASGYLRGPHVWMERHMREQTGEEAKQ